MWRKVSDVEIKYFATSDYNKFTHDTIDAKIKGKGFLDKCTIAAFRNSADMNKKVATLATKAEEDKIIKLQVFDSSYFRCKSRFEDCGTENYLLFQPIYRYF